MKALLIETPTQEFLVEERHLKSVIEYAKTFKANIFEVDLQRGKALNLPQLSKAICNAQYFTDAEYAILNKVFPSGKSKQKSVIDEFVRNRLLQGKPMSLQEIKKRFPNLADSYLCNHFTITRNKLTQEGHKIQKVGKGVYFIAK